MALNVLLANQGPRSSERELRRKRGDWMTPTTSMSSQECRVGGNTYR